jgi:hypothetical protein
VETPAGTFVRALEVVYEVDYGIIEAALGPPGFRRVIAYGKVIYAPTLGPVALWERDLVPVGTAGPGIGLIQRELSLQGVRAGTD